MNRTTISGFDGLEKQIKQMAKGFERASGTHEVSFGELFPPGFMRRYTRFATIQALFDASGFAVETKEDIAAIPDADWDRHIRSSTTFANWESMQKAAGTEWIRRRVGI